MGTRALLLVAAAALTAVNGRSAAQTAQPLAGSTAPTSLPGWSSDLPLVRDREALKAKTSDDRRLAAYHDWQSPVGETLQGVTHVIFCDSEMPPPPPGEQIVRPEYRAFLKDVACRYDAIAVGGAALRRVMLNESESAVFSEYSLSVEEWILPNAGERVIRVSRAGGLAKLADGSALGIEFNGSSEPLGRRLFLLTRIPGTPSFRIAKSVEIASGYIQPRFPEIEFGYWPEEFLSNPFDASRFLRDLASAARRCSATAR